MHVHKQGPYVLQVMRLVGRVGRPGCTRLGRRWHRDALRVTGSVEAVSSEESGLLCEIKRRAPERVGARLGEDYDFSPLARPVEQPSRHNASSAHQQAPPNMPHQSHALTSCLGPAEDLRDAALLAGGVRDTPPDRPGASEAPSGVVTAKARTRASQKVEPELDVKLAPPVHVTKQREPPRREVSPAPSNSDAETVCAPYPAAQLGYEVNQDARSGPVRDHRGPCPDEFEAGAPNNASHASGAIPEPISHTPGGSNNTRPTVHLQPEAHAGADSVFSPHHVSRAREFAAPSSSAKAPAVLGKLVQCAPAGVRNDETRPARRRVFVGPTVVRDVPREVPPPEEQRVVSPLSSRPVFTGPGSIPRRAECFHKRATTFPSGERTEAPSLESVHEASATLHPGGRPLPPRPPSPKRKRREPEGVSRSSGTDSSDEGITQDCAEAFLAKLDTRPTCSSGHPLFSFGSPEPGWWCSACKRVFSTRRLLWGCRVCDFDICGNCLVDSRSGSSIAPAPVQGVVPEAIPAAHVQNAAQEAIPSGTQTGPAVKLLRASGVLTGSDMFPNDLHLTLGVNGESLSVLGSCRAPELKGGFRKVYHLRGEGPAASMVLKLAENDADNVNEVRSAAACPAAFTRIYGSGSIWVSLGADGLCQAHYIISERVVPLTALLDGPALPPTACASLALQCCRVVFRATLAGIKCRTLGRSSGASRSHQVSNSKMRSPCIKCAKA